MSVERWLTPQIRNKLEFLCALNHTPLGISVGWIEVESGGNLHEITDLDERGLFQLSPAESRDLHIEHDLLSSDLDYSLESGFKLIAYYQQFVDRCQVAAKGSEFYWRLVKLFHAAGAGATGVYVRAAKAAGAMSSWDAMYNYCASHDMELREATKHSPSTWMWNVDKLIRIGRPYGVELLIPPPTDPKPNS